jgi:hypothetical protein
VPEWSLLRKTGVSHRNVQASYRSISRRLFSTEQVVLDLQVSQSLRPPRTSLDRPVRVNQLCVCVLCPQRLWLEGHLPIEFVTKLEDIGPEMPTYASIHFLDLSSAGFRKKIPATLDNFFQKLERRASEVREALRDYWVDEAASRVSLDLWAMSRLGDFETQCRGPPQVLEFLDKLISAGNFEDLDQKQLEAPSMKMEPRNSLRAKEVDDADDEYEKWYARRHSSRHYEPLVLTLAVVFPLPRYQENYASKVGGASPSKSAMGGGHAEAHEDPSQQAAHLLQQRLDEEGLTQAAQGKKGPAGARAAAPPESPQPRVDPVKGMLDTVAVLMSRQLRSKCETMFLQVKRLVGRLWEGR